MEKLLRKIKQYGNDGHCLLILAGGGTLLGAVLFYFALHRPLAAAADECSRQALADRKAYTQVINFQNAHLDVMGDLQLVREHLFLRLQACVHLFVSRDAANQESHDEDT